MLPRSINSWKITVNLTAILSTRLCVSSVITKSSAQGFVSGATVTSHATTSPHAKVLEVNGLYCQALSSTSSATTNTDETKLCFEAIWKPDVNLLDADQFASQVIPIPDVPGTPEVSSLRTLASLLIHEIPRLRLSTINATINDLDTQIFNVFALSTKRQSYGNVRIRRLSLFNQRRKEKFLQ
jgi:hypothetical protein